MRSLESRIYKRLALFAFLGPIICAPAGALVAGQDGAMAGLMLPIMAALPLGLLAGTVLAVTRHVSQRRELRANLASPAACRTMSKPCLAAPVSAMVLFVISVPLLALATQLAARDGSGSWPGIAVLTGLALLPQWVGMQGIGDYLLARRAWRESRASARP